MRIAVASIDQERVTRHFGQSRYYVVFTIEGGRCAKRETMKIPRQTPSKAGNGKGLGRRVRVALEDTDKVDIVVARGMGKRAYERIIEADMIPILTDIEEVDVVPVAYVRGALTDHPERIEDSCSHGRAGRHRDNG